MHKSPQISNRLFNIDTFYEKVLACSLLVLATLPLGVLGQDGVPEDATGVPGISSALFTPNDQLNWRDGELYAPLSGMMNHYIEDMKIEGNGMPIVIARQHLGGRSVGRTGLGGIGLAIPRISFVSYGGGPYFKKCDKNNCFHNDTVLEIPPQRTCQGLKIAGAMVGSYENNVKWVPEPGITNLRSGIRFNDGKRQVYFFPRNEAPGNIDRFPSSAAYVSADNWYISCNGTSFKVHTDDGITYLMSNWFSYQAVEKGRAAHNIYVDTIEDPHGNWIKYNFPKKEPYLNNVKGKVYSIEERISLISPQLLSIETSDNRMVTIKYGTGRFSRRIYSIYDNGIPRQRKVDYVVGSNNEKLTVTYEDGTKKVYGWKIYGLLTSMNSIQLPGGGVIEYQYEPTYHSNYTHKVERPIQVLRLKRRTLHTTLNSPAVVEHDFGWKSIDEETFSRTISSASNTVEYHLRKTHRSVSKEPASQFVFQWAKDAGRIIEFKNHGRRIEDNDWKVDLEPEYRRKTVWSEVSRVANFAGFMGKGYLKHPGFASYYESIVVAPKEIITTMRKSNGGYMEFKIINESFNEFGQPTRSFETSNDTKVREIIAEYHDTSTPWINGLVAHSEVKGDNLIVNEYNPNGTLDYTTTNGVRTDYTYHSDGNLKTITNADGPTHVHRYDNYVRGISELETDANGHVISREVNTDGTLKWVTVKGHTVKTEYEYDELRRVSKIKSPENRVIDITHEPKVSTTYNNGLINLVRRDGLGREIFNGNFGNMGSTDNVNINWSSVLTRYDADGRVAFVSHPWSINDMDAYYSPEDFKIGLSYKYDGLGRVIKIENHADGDAYGVGDFSYEYNKDGLETHTIDDLGKRTINRYRSYGSPEEPMLLGTTNHNGRSTNIIRDDVGRILLLNRYGNNRYFYYNDRRQLKQETNPETGITDYTYWPDGQLYTRTHQGVRTVYEYDKHNRLTKETLSESNGNTLVRDYDYRDDDLLRWIKNTSTGYSPSQATETAYSYDWDGNLTSETLAVDDQQMNMEFTYDDRGALSTVRYPSARRYDLHPNAHGWPTKLIDDAGKIVYDTIEHHPNGMLHNLKRPSYSYSQELWWLRMPAELKSVGSGLKSARQLYRYYENLNVSNIEGSLPSENLILDYDNLNRLTLANSGFLGRWEYEYDNFDNIDWVIHDGVKTDYEYDLNTNRLTRMKTGVVDRWMSYDPRGNIYDTDKHYLTFNAANQVLTSSDGASYVYDGQGRRVKTVRDGKTVYQMYDQSGKLRYRSEPEQNLQSEYLYVNDKLFARRDTDDLTGGEEYGEIFRDDFDGDSVSSNFFVPTWSIPGRAAVNNINSCSQSNSVLSLSIKNVGNESQACYLFSNIGDIGPGDDSTIKIEYHANVSGVKAKGAWFAGWIYPKGLNPDGSHPAEDNNPATGAEYDVFEYMPTWDTAYNTAIHDGGTEQQWIYGDLLNGIDLKADQFHTYSMEWNKDCVVFSIDGIPVRASTSPLISSAKKHAIYLSMEAQTGKQWDFWDIGDFRQNLDQNPTVGKIDWVSVSRKAGVDPNLCDGAPPSDPPTDPPPGDVTPWGPPQGLSASADSDSQISLSWNPVDTAIKYNVYRDDQYINTVTGVTNYADTGLTSGTTYSYYVTAIRDTATDQFSGKSSSASATTLGDTNPPPSGTTPWGPPQGLSASTDSDSQISLSWNPVDTAIKYNVYRDDQYIDTVTGVTNYADSGLTSGTTYSYYVTAIRDTATDQFSGKSSSASATTSGGTNPPPSSGSNPTAPVLSGQDYSSSAIEITWSPSSDSDGAVVEYEVVRSANGQSITHVTNGRSWWQDNLSANTEYTYSVKAVDNDGNRSASSNVITVRTRP